METNHIRYHKIGKVVMVATKHENNHLGVINERGFNQYDKATPTAEQLDEIKELIKELGIKNNSIHN